MNRAVKTKTVETEVFRDETEIFEILGIPKDIVGKKFRFHCKQYIGDEQATIGGYIQGFTVVFNTSYYVKLLISISIRDFKFDYITYRAVNKTWMAVGYFTSKWSGGMPGSFEGELQIS